MPKQYHVELYIGLASGNEAFQEEAREEVANILLKQVVDPMRKGSEGSPLRDRNGNQVGNWWLDLDEEESPV